MTTTPTTGAEMPEALRLADEYAEVRHVCGTHLYNAKTEAARNALIAAISAAAPAAPAVDPLTGIRTPTWDELHSAWLRIGAESKGLSWDQFTTAARMVNTVAVPQAGAESYPPPKLAKELVRLADIMRDCGRLISTSGQAEQVFREAAAALRARGAVPMPPSYESSTLSTRRPTGTGCRVAFHFGNTEEAERWMDGVLSAPAAPMSAQPNDFEQAVQVLGDRLAREHAVYLTRNSARKLLASVLAAPAAAAPAAVDQDAALLDFLAAESLDLRCFDMPTGQGDADVGWRTVQHHMGAPKERVASEVYRDDPRQAIREAMERIKRDPYCAGPLHLAAAPQAPAGEGGAA